METLLHLGLSNAITATLLAVAVAVLGRMCRRPALTHGLWLLVLVKLLTPPLFTIAIPWPSPAEAEHAEHAVHEFTSTPAMSPVLLATDDGMAQQRPGPFQTATEPAPELIDDAPGAPVAEPEAEARSFPWAATVLVVWLAGSLLWLLLAGVRVQRFRRLLRFASPAPLALQEQACRLAGRLGLRRCPAVSLIPGPVSPLLWAVGRPRVLLPAGLWGRLSREQQDTLLLHELAHLRRRDHWVRLLEVLAVALYWWHPVAWWARRELHEAEEHCCDAWVVWALPGAAASYAAMLVETIGFLSQARAALPATASGIGHVQTLKRRLTMILRGTSPRRLSGTGLLTVLGLAVLLPLVPAWATQPPAQPARAEGAGGNDPVKIKGTAAAPEEAPRPAAEPATRPGAARPEEKPAREPGIESDLQKAQDDVELLQVQLQVQKAHLDAVSIVYRQARDRQARVEALFKSGTIAAGELEKARAEAAAAQVQLHIKEAELLEPEVRLKQALRRLAALRGPAAKAPADVAPEKARLQELEKKVDRLLEEMNALRREMRKKEGGAGETKPEGEVLRINQRDMQIPVQIRSEERARIKKVELLSSVDEGQTWRVVGINTPDAKTIPFAAPADGLYWLSVRTTDVAGQEFPSDIKQLRPMLKVLVATEK